MWLFQYENQTVKIQFRPFYLGKLYISRLISTIKQTRIGFQDRRKAVEMGSIPSRFMYIKNWKRTRISLLQERLVKLIKLRLW